MGKWGNEEKPITSLFNLENLIKKKICRTDVKKLKANSSKLEAGS